MTDITNEIANESTKEQERNQSTKQTANLSLNQDHWDYSEQAQYYEYRPNYDKKAIDQILKLTGLKDQPGGLIADIGAGTGNLTELLVPYDVSVLALEPNASMRSIGKARVNDKKVTWLAATAESTGLQNESVDLFIMGSSFNTTERDQTLEEAKRVLKPSGWFVCLWNHRDLVDDPIQAQAEKIIREFYPNYSHGTRREDQSPILESKPFFGRHEKIEIPQLIEQPIENYILAWKSVRNQHWDLRDSKQLLQFEAMCEKLRSELPETLQLKYTTRAWLSQLAVVQ